MLKQRAADFHEVVWRLAAQIGSRNAAKVTEILLKEHFPKTTEEAGYEGAIGPFRNGVKAAVTSVFKKVPGPSEQFDFGDLYEEFWTEIEPLRSRSYYVEEIGDYVSVPLLIENPEMLDDARKHMRRKGKEVLDEADRIDALFKAVMRKRASTTTP